MDRNNLKKIDEIISNYQYGKQNFLEQKFKIEYSLVSELVFIKNFYSFNPEEKYGVCHELAMRTYLNIKKEMPQIYTFRCEGYDDKLFMPRNKSETKSINHVFLLCIEVSKIENKGKTSFTELMENESVIVDPSYKLIQPFKETKYKANTILCQNDPINYSLDLELNNTRSSPIGYKKDTLVDLCFNKDFSSRLGFQFSKINEKNKRESTIFDYNNRTLRKHIKQILNKEEDNLIELIQKISYMKINESNKKFERNIITIE